VKKSREKYKAQLDQHKIKKTFKVIDRVWLHPNKEWLWSPHKKIMSMWYAPFEVLEKVDDDAYKLILPPYMKIFLVVNMENMKLCEPSMLDQETNEQVLPTI
jgi:hypothetical protein